MVSSRDQNSLQVLALLFGTQTFDCIQSSSQQLLTDTKHYPRRHLDFRERDELFTAAQYSVHPYFEQRYDVLFLRACTTVRRLPSIYIDINDFVLRGSH